MKNIFNSKIVLLLVLVMIMASTRFSPAAEIFHLQDASWAVFFAAGFYLAQQWRWAFPALMVVAVLIDYAAIQYFSVSNYCVTPAYWFLVPSYAALWAGGSCLRRFHSMDVRGIALLAVTVSVSVSLCFLISNASFYWMGGRVAEVSWNGWLENFSAWFWPFFRAPLAYIGVSAMIHVIAMQAAKFLGRDSESKR